MKHRNSTIDSLRGVAAVMVCVCHLRHALPEAAHAMVKTYGELGVQVFFVISGYIIPFSLLRSDYRLRDFGRFWIKRLVRLQPTYVAALLFTFLASHAVAFAKHSAPPFTWTELLLGSVYLHVPEENPVFWTLIVELKYYVFVALLFPLLFAKGDWIRRSSFLACAGIVFLGHARFDFLHYLPYFLIGFCGCYVATARAGRLEAMVLAAAATASAVSAEASAVQLVAAWLTLVIVVLRPIGDWKTGAFLGAISYSLYVIHFPLGVKLLNLTLPHAPGWAHLPLGLGIFGVMLSVAYLLYVTAELPSAQWSQMIKISSLRGSGLRVRLGAEQRVLRERWQARARIWRVLSAARRP